MTDENPTWDEAFSNAAGIVEGAYSLTYAPKERAALRESLRRKIGQPLRLVKIAKLIPDSFKLFSNRLPTPEFWLRIHKESGFVAPNTYGHKCDKCDDVGWIEYAHVRLGIRYTPVALCNCEKGRWLNSHYQPPKKYFEDFPGVAAALQDGRIKIENGRAINIRTGELVQWTRKAERDPEPKPEPEEPEDIRDTYAEEPEQEEIPF